MAHLVPGGRLPNLESQNSTVLQQLERLLGHAAFRNSKRNRALLRYVVEHQLQNPGIHLKERTIGIDVFGRDPGYDTNADPVVRIVAGEIRRRIAQYYHEAGHEEEIRIELPSGTYAPEFHFPASPANGKQPHAEALASASSAGTAPPKQFARKWLVYSISALFFSVLGLSGMVSWHMEQKAALAGLAANGDPSPLHQFWGRITHSSNPVQVVLGTRSLDPGELPQHRSDLLIKAQALTYFPDVVGWRDLVAASRLIELLQERRKAFLVEDARTITINSLAQSPAVLVGGFNNPWVMSLGDSLRFHFVKRDNQMWIADREDTHARYVLSPGVIPGSTRDYGIIARLTDKVTGQVSIIVAGIGAPATMAASAFITNAREVKDLARRLPKGWESKNLEALISVQDIRGEPGAPHIVAVKVW